MRTKSSERTSKSHARASELGRLGVEGRIPSRARDEDQSDLDDPSRYDWSNRIISVIRWLILLSRSISRHALEGLPVNKIKDRERFTNRMQRVYTPKII